MKLKITKTRKIYEIQNEFNSYFEYLKIEFCTKPDDFPDSFGSRFIMNTNKRLSDVSNSLAEKTISLTCTMPVNELKRIFENEIGIPVKILRKSGVGWHDTSLTHEWSLGKQNQYGSLLAVTIGGEQDEKHKSRASSYPQ